MSTNLITKRTKFYTEGTKNVPLRPWRLLSELCGYFFSRRDPLDFIVGLQIEFVLPHFVENKILTCSFRHNSLVSIEFLEVTLFSLSNYLPTAIDLTVGCLLKSMPFHFEEYQITRTQL